MRGDAIARPPIMKPWPCLEAAPPDTGPSFVAETRFQGCFATTSWPRKAVERLLPSGLRLAAGPGGSHPVVFTFGEHDQSAVLFAALRLATGAVFPELVIAVPSVRRGDGEPATFVRRVFSGEPVATWSGNVHYGFTKTLVAMEKFGNSFVVTDERGALALHATTEPTSPWERAASSALPGLAAAVTLARRPVLGCKSDGTWVSSRFEWGFEDAEVRSVRGVVSIDAPLGPGLEPRTCHAAARESFEVRGMRWRLSWPEAGD